MEKTTKVGGKQMKGTDISGGILTWGGKIGQKGGGGKSGWLGSIAATFGAPEENE